MHSDRRAKSIWSTIYPDNRNTDQMKEMITNLQIRSDNLNPGMNIDYCHRTGPNAVCLVITRYPSACTLNSLFESNINNIRFIIIHIWDPLQDQTERHKLDLNGCWWENPSSVMIKWGWRQRFRERWQRGPDQKLRAIQRKSQAIIEWVAAFWQSTTESEHYNHRATVVTWK